MSPPGCLHYFHVYLHPAFISVRRYAAPKWAILKAYMCYTGHSEHDLKHIAVNSDTEFFDPARENCPSDVVAAHTLSTIFGLAG